MIRERGGVSGALPGMAQSSGASSPDRPPHLELVPEGGTNHITWMTLSDRWRRTRRIPAVRHALWLTGWLLILLTPVVGILPGPGGIFVFAAGAALVLETSPRAKRRYVRLKRRWPRAGGWIDRGLRRPSERRRRERAATVPGAC